MRSVHSPTSGDNKSSFVELEETLVYINLEKIIIGDARIDYSTDYIWDTTALDNLSDAVGITEPIKCTLANKTEAGRTQAGITLTMRSLISASASLDCKWQSW